MTYVVGIRSLVDLPGYRNGDLYRVHGGHGVRLHEQRLRLYEAGRAALTSLMFASHMA